MKQFARCLLSKRFIRQSSRNSETSLLIEEREGITDRTLFLGRLKKTLCSFLLITAINMLSFAFSSEDTNVPMLKWDFKHSGDTEGWTIPEHFTGRVMGDALWITMTAKEFSYTHPIKNGIINRYYTIDSPTGLEIPADKYNKVRLRLYNMSPETDGYIHWTTTDERGEKTNRRRIHFPMKPYHTEWQEIVCHIDGAWKGTIDQIRITPGLLTHKGDIWIDWIDVSFGPGKPTLPKPDVNSQKVVPSIVIPGVTQEDFQEAFNIMSDSLYVEVPFHGFEYPFTAPGAHGSGYGWSWWPFDLGITVGGQKWVNQEFVENVIRGLIKVQSQNPDGRYDLWGGAPARGGCGHGSCQPVYFEGAYDVMRRCKDRALQTAVFESFKKNLQWWFSPVKRDGRTGLITGWSEETVSYWCPPQTIAHVDLNVCVALGCYYTAALAQELGCEKDAGNYSKMFKELSRLINNYLWDDKDGVYYPYNVNTGKREPKLICSTFDPFRLNIARPEQIERLIPKLLDPNLFNWDKIPLTTVAKTHPQYNEPTEWGQGDAWLGNVWMLRNLSTIKGLINIGRHDLAAELSWKTIKAFNGNFAESIVPSTGEAFGVKRYCWSATGYVQTIIEHLFGVDYDATRGKLCVMPHIPKELKNEAISIKDLILPTSGNTRLSVTVSPGKISGGRLISIEIDGDLEQNIDVVVLQPESPEREAPRVMEPTTGIKFEFVKELGDTKNVVGIRSPMIKELKVRFEL